MQIKKIYGPPGTGKTTRLLDILEKELGRGVDPKRVAFVSFTKKAAEEGTTRAQAALGIGKAALPHFRTLHSMCFRLLHLGRDGVVQRSHYAELAKLTGVEYNGRMSMEDGVIQGDAEGDRYLFLDQLARNRCITLKDAWEDSGDDLNWIDLEYFINALGEYKTTNGLRDFTDMLQQVLDCPALDIDVAIIDEAQDMTPLQWKVAFHLFQGASRMYIAGDDDQAIYKWSGADATYFNSIDGQVEVLERSYRLPSKVFDTANAIAELISDRMEKTWHPDREGGVVEWHATLDSLDVSDGTWLLLARNKYMLADLMTAMQDKGVAYTTRMGSSITRPHLDAIMSWEGLRRDADVRVEHLKGMLTLMGYANIFGGRNQDDKMNMEQVREAGVPDNGSWYKVLHKIPLATREYYSSIILNGEKLTTLPRIHIDTIHGVKGGEADNVLLMLDQGYRTWRAAQNDPDSEHRVMYVGATRAKKALHILMPQTDKAYNGI